jgi:hypothetical protein
MRIALSTRYIGTQPISWRRERARDVLELFIATLEDNSTNTNKKSTDKKLGKGEYYTYTEKGEKVLNKPMQTGFFS